MNPTLTALAGFVAWSLFLLVLMEVIRSKLVITKAVAANGFTPDNSNFSPFMQRLARSRELHRGFAHLRWSHDCCRNNR